MKIFPYDYTEEQVAELKKYGMERVAEYCLWLNGEFWISDGMWVPLRILRAHGLL